MGRDTLKILFRDNVAFNIFCTAVSSGNIVTLGNLGIRRNISNDLLCKIRTALQKTHIRIYFCSEMAPNETKKKTYRLFSKEFFSNGKKTTMTNIGFLGGLRLYAIDLKDQNNQDAHRSDFDYFVQAIQDNISTQLIP